MTEALREKDDLIRACVMDELDNLVASTRDRSSRGLPDETPAPHGHGQRNPCGCRGCQRAQRCSGTRPCRPPTGAAWSAVFSAVGHPRLAGERSGLGDQPLVGPVELVESELLPAGDERAAHARAERSLRDRDGDSHGLLSAALNVRAARLESSAWISHGCTSSRKQSVETGRTAPTTTRPRPGWRVSGRR